MNNTLITGRCFEHNENVPVSVAHSGHLKTNDEDLALKIDELNFKIDNVNENITSFQTYIERSRLQEHRKNGEVFIASYEGIHAGTDPNNDNFTVLLNPSTNTKNIYIYNVKNSINFNTFGIISRVYFGLTTEANISGGSVGGSIVNLNAASANNTNCILYYDIFTIPFQQLLERYRVVDTGENLNWFNDFQEEYIQIPPGQAFFIRISRGAAIDHNYDFNIRFVETEDQL